MDDNLAYFLAGDRNERLARCKYPHNVTILKELPKRINDLAESCGVSQLGDEVCLKGVTAEYFYRGRVPNAPGLAYKECRNDGLRRDNLHNVTNCGESTHKE